MSAAAGTPPETNVAVANLIRWLETGTAPQSLFAPDVFADVSLPHWRLQATTAAVSAISPEGERHARHHHLPPTRR